jgi:pimeloyl-ACP methyl ester carboxylesterase
VPESKTELTPAQFEVGGDGPLLKGEAVGEGPPIVLCHGITATRRYVVHGSQTLARRGHKQVSYDARGHGSSEPAPAGGGYSYAELADDLERVIAAEVSDAPLVLAGHSMGSHTVVVEALRNPERLAGLVVIGPVQMGLPSPESAVSYWNRLADGLESGGVDGFMEVYDGTIENPDWRETILRFTRARMEEHVHPEAVAQAMREIALNQPFESIDELEFLDLPALVVASHDDADPGHPYAVAEAYAAKLPQAKLISEEKGESPLAWQGGRLAREIADFIDGL